jgi:hypothetical protein
MRVVFPTQVVPRVCRKINAGEQILPCRPLVLLGGAMEYLGYKLFKRIHDDSARLIIAKRATSQDILREVLLERYSRIKRKPRSQ